MENYRGRLLWITMGVLFIVSAQAKGPGNPLGQVNSSPFQQWRSAWECMQNTSTNCTTENSIQLNGVPIRNGTELTRFCQKGCSKHTKNVLSCIRYVKRDLRFGNGATVQNITDAIIQACTANKNNSTNYKSSAVRAYQNLLLPPVASLATVLIVNIFNI